MGRKKVVYYGIQIFCHLFVLYMIVQCFRYFFQHPEGIDLTMKENNEELYPQITLCSGAKLNKTVLQECQLQW